MPEFNVQASPETISIDWPGLTLEFSEWQRMMDALDRELGIMPGVRHWTNVAGNRWILNPDSLHKRGIRPETAKHRAEGFFRHRFPDATVKGEFVDAV